MNATELLSGLSAEDRKLWLLRAAFRQISGELYEIGDSERYPWVWREIARIEADFEKLDYNALQHRLRWLFKDFAKAKGRQRADLTFDERGGDHMPIELKWAEPTVAPGSYRAKIVNLSKGPGSYGKDVVTLTFELDSGKQLKKHYSATLSPNSKLGAVVSRLLGRGAPGQAVDVERLVGLACEVFVTHEEDDEGNLWPRVTDVFAVKE